MRTVRTVTKKQAKRLLPAALKRYRKRNEKVAVVTKRDAHDPRLPANRIAKAKAKLLAERQEATAKAIKAHLRGLPKEVAEADVKAPVAEAAETKTAEVAGV